jgi:hypothetical protein
VGLEPEAERLHKAHRVHVTEHFAYLTQQDIMKGDMVEPRSFKEAQKSAEAAMWKKASDEEMAAQLANESFVLVPRTPDMNVLKCRWVYKHKKDESGQVVRWKGRLVVQGFLQQRGLDFFETFAAVAKISSVRLMLAIAAVLDLELHQLDVDTAFLQAPVDEVIFMTQPEGYVKLGPKGEEMVCRLLKSI